MVIHRAIRSGVNETKQAFLLGQVLKMVSIGLPVVIACMVIGVGVGDVRAG